MKIKNLFKLFVFVFFMGVISCVPLFTKNKVHTENLITTQEETGYLTFSSNNEFSMSRAESPASLDYSIDGSTWQSFPTSNSSTTNSITSGLKDGKYVLYLRNSENIVNTVISGYNETDDKPILEGFKFESGSNVDCSGNILTLLDYKKVLNGEEPVLGDYAFACLFSECDALISSPILPSTVIPTKAYYRMFYCCENLKRAPELPATSFVSGSEYNYSYMFFECSNLENAPALPITTLTEACYYNMFGYCLKIEIAPELPATTLTDCCYYGMFVGCESLTTAPELPATTLASECYATMFERCESLTKAPELPATTLAWCCYYYMFSECDKLTIAPDLPALKLFGSCYESMFSSCKSLVKLPKIAATDFSGYNCCKYMFADCTNIKISTEKTENYKYEWSLSENTINSENVSLYLMFMNTGGTYMGDCKAGVKYYLDILCDHTYFEWIEEKLPTCASLGVKAHYECTNCGYAVDSDYNEYTDLYIDKTSDHRLGDWIAEIPSNCINTGVKAHYECSVCKGYFDKDKNPITSIELPKDLSKHSFGTLILGSPATCYKEGFVDYYECEDCHCCCDVNKKILESLYDFIIPRVEHEYSDDEDVTCNNCDYTRIIINYSNYEVDGSVYDIKVSLSEGVTDISLPEDATYDRYTYCISEIFDPSGWGSISNNSNPYFLPNKKYYLYIYFEIDEDVDYENLYYTQILVGGKGGVVLDKHFDEVDLDEVDLYVDYFCVIISLPVLGGESKIKDVPKLSYSFEGIEVGKLIKDVNLISSETNLKLYYEVLNLFKQGFYIDDDSTEVFDTTYITQLFLYLAAPAGYTFINFTKDKLYLEGFDNNYDFEIRESGSRLCIYLDISLRTEECSHPSVYWDYDDEEHYGLCDICAKYIYSEHVYDDDLDFDCNICDFYRGISFGNIDFVLTGYSEGSPVSEAKLDFDNTDLNDFFCIYYITFSYSKDFYMGYIEETFNYFNTYYLGVQIYFERFIDISRIDFSKIKIKGIDAELYNYFANIYDPYDYNPTSSMLILYFELPRLVDENNSVTKVTKINAALENVKLGKTVGDVTIKVDGLSQDIAKIFDFRDVYGRFINKDTIFENNNTYVVMIGFDSNGEYDLSELESKDITVTNTTGFFFDEYNTILKITIYYYFITFVDEGHTHLFNNDYLVLNNSVHYNLCSCGNINLEPHVYENNNLSSSTCTKCDYEGLIYVENISLSLENWKYGSTLSDLKIKVNTFGIHELISEYYPYVAISTSSNIYSYVYYYSNVIDYENYIFLDDGKYYLIVELAFDQTIGIYMDLYYTTTKNVYLEGVGNPISIMYNDYYGENLDTFMAIFELPQLEAPHIHGGKWIIEVPATCETDGTKAHYECSVCGKYFDINNIEIEDLKINKLNHNYSEVTYELVDDNTKMKATRVCSHDSSHIETEIVEVTKQVTQNATCTQDEISSFTAEFANAEFGTKTIANVKTGSMINHTNIEHHEKVDATCAKEGTIEYWSCPDCSKKYSNEECTIEVTDLNIKKLDHNYQCHYNSSTHYLECETCHDKVDEQEHSWNDGIITKDANTKEEGIKTYSCKHCDATRTEIIPKTKGCASLSYTFFTLCSVLCLLLIIRKKQTF